MKLRSHPKTPATETQAAQGNRKAPYTALELLAFHRYQLLAKELAGEAASRADLARRLGIYSLEVKNILEEGKVPSLRALSATTETLGIHSDYFFLGTVEDKVSWRDFMLENYAPQGREAPETQRKVTDGFELFADSPIGQSTPPAVMDILKRSDASYPVTASGYTAVALAYAAHGRSPVELLTAPTQPVSNDHEEALNEFLSSLEGKTVKDHERDYLRQHQWPPGFVPNGAAYKSLFDSLRYGDWGN